MAPGHFGRALTVFGISLALWLIPATAGGSLGRAHLAPRHVDHGLFDEAALARGDSIVEEAIRRDARPVLAVGSMAATAALAGETPLLPPGTSRRRG